MSRRQAKRVLNSESRTRNWYSFFHIDEGPQHSQLASRDAKAGPYDLRSWNFRYLDPILHWYGGRFPHRRERLWNSRKKSLQKRLGSIRCLFCSRNIINYVVTILRIKRVHRLERQTSSWLSSWKRRHKTADWSQSKNKWHWWYPRIDVAYTQKPGS